MGRYQTRQRVGMNYIEGGAASPTTPRRAALEIARQNSADHPNNVLIGDKKMHKCMALYGTKLGS